MPPSRRELFAPLAAGVGLLALPLAIPGAAPKAGELVARWVKDEESDVWWLKIGPPCALQSYGILGRLEASALFRPSPIAQPDRWLYRNRTFEQKITAASVAGAKRQAEVQAAIWARQALADVERLMFAP